MHGAVALQSEWLGKDTAQDIAVYVVWSPQLGAREKNVASAAALIPDHRARHYWDGGRLVGSAFQPLLGLLSAAWDTWMVFDRNMTWRGDTPPMPAWWEHQLSAGPPERHLDPARFASHAETLHNAAGSRR